MIVFFLSAALLLLLALWVLLRALLRGQGDSAASREQQNIRIARERLDELAQQHRSGGISDGEYRAQREEIERALLDDLPGDSNEASHGGGRWAAFAVAAALPVLAGALYLGIGQPAALAPDTAVAGAEGRGDDRHPANMEQMVEQLAQRMEQDRDNAEGWAMLARSYMTMGRFPDAVGAFENLQRLIPDDPQILVRHADAVAMANGGRLEGKPGELVERALKIQPDNTQGLWMAGTAARQAGNHEQAVAYFERLVPLLDNEMEVQNQIRQLIADSRSLLGSDTADKDGQRPPQPDPPTAGLTVEVSLDPGLEARTEAQDMVFVYARAVQGPPMPLAVVRKRVADLPLTVTLDDASAMMPQMTLSKFEQVKVGARISKTGQPLPSSGDLEGVVSPVSTSEQQPVKVVINNVVP